MEIQYCVHLYIYGYDKMKHNIEIVLTFDTVFGKNGNIWVIDAFIFLDLSCETASCPLGTNWYNFSLQYYEIAAQVI